MEEAHIPNKTTGNQIDAVSLRELSNEAEAMILYRVAKDRLMNVSEWQSISTVSTARFELVDEEGNLLDIPARKGYRVRISIPGSSTSLGNGYDWVWIEKIHVEEGRESEITALTLRPGLGPISDETSTAHFLKSIASSTLIVRRDGRKVIAEFHGRNEVAKVDTTKITEKIRNFIVGLVGKWGASYPIWKGLTEGLIEYDFEYR